MKKVILFLGAAAIIGVGSAFGTISKAGAGEYVKIGGVYQLKGDGNCLENEPGTCDYTIIDPQGSMTDDGNFTPYQQGLWVE